LFDDTSRSERATDDLDWTEHNVGAVIGRGRATRAIHDVTGIRGGIAQR